MSLILNAIPLQYRIIAAVIIVVVVVGGAFTYGYTKGSAKSATEIAKYSARNADLQSKIDNQQVKVVDHIITQYVDRIVKVKETGVHNEQVAKNVVPDNTVLSNGWVYVHDSAVEGNNADATISADATPSGIEANQALGTVTSNYAQCHATEEQLIALQDWVTDTKANIDAQNTLALKKKHWWNKNG